MATPDIPAEVLRLTRAGLTSLEIVAALGVSRGSVERWKQLLAASYLDDPAFSEPPAGPVVIGGKGVVTGRDPSPAQIRRRAAAIRRTWSEAERRAREGELPDGLSHKYSEARRGRRVG